MIKLVTLINERKFGKSRKAAGKLKLVMNVPMFSVYVPENTPVTKEAENDIKSETSKARNEIHKIGFPSMHANIVIKELPGLAGRAHHYKKFMEIDPKYFHTDVIVHEWAHLWMMNNSKEFKKAIDLLYKKMRLDVGSKIDISQFSQPLDSNEELRIINSWSDGLEKMFRYMLFERETRSFILKHLKLTSDLFSNLPHLISIKAKLIRPIIVHSFRGAGKTLQQGTEVDVIKGNSGWLIGVEINGERYEMLTENYNQIFDYVKPVRSDDIVKDLQIALQQDNKRNSEYNKSSYLARKIGEKLMSGLKNILEDISKKYNVKPTQEEEKALQSWVTYILPRFLEILKSRKLLDLHQKKQSIIYDSIWVSNRNKPSDLSFTKFFTNIINRNKGETYKKSFIDSPSLAGPEFASHRQTMKNLHNWVDEYGMSNQDELWATAIEYFFKLPLNYRKIIVKLMLNM